MSDQIAVALIALSGVIISVLVSLYSSLRQTNSEFRKMRTEIQQTYADKLLEKRIAVYPDLYKLLSIFTKEIKSTGRVSKDTLLELQTDLAVWDVNNAVFMSGKAFEFLYRFGNLVNELANQAENQFDDPSLLLTVRAQADKVKLALKEDLGIFVVEFPEEEVNFTSFQEIAETTVTEDHSHSNAA